MDFRPVPSTAHQLPLASVGFPQMTHEDFVYHSERARQCRNLAEKATDPEIGRRHAELADLHAARAANYTSARIVSMQSLSAA